MEGSRSYEIGKNVTIGLLAGAGAILVVGLVMLGLGLNEAFYSEEPVLASFFEAITFAGDELFFIIAISFIYFGINQVFARKLLYGFLASMHVNSFTKAMFRDPRPVTNVGRETSYGFPSGHTQSNAAFWGFSMIYHRKHEKAAIPLIIVGITMVVLVPISRLVMGVHDLDDIIGGYVIGAIVLYIYLLVDTRIVSNMTWDWTQRVAIGAAAWMTMWVISILVLPDNAADFGLALGLLVGISVGFPIEQEFVKYDVRRLPPAKRLLSGVVGTLLTIATYLVLGLAFGGITAVPWVTRLVRYAVMGFLVSAVYPWLIKKILKH